MKKFIIALSLVLFPALAFAGASIKPITTHVDCSRFHTSVDYSMAPAKLRATSLDWFGMAERGQKEEDASFDLCYGIAYAKAAKVTLESLGTSEKQLALVQKTSLRNSALHWLQRVRELAKKEAIDDLVDLLKRDAALSGSSLKSLGTSEVELKALRHQGYHSSALSAIRDGRAEKNPNDAALYFDSAKYWAERAGEDFKKLMKLPQSALPPPRPPLQPERNESLFPPA